MGGNDISQLSLIDDLDLAFGAGNYSITQDAHLVTATKSSVSNKAATAINFDSSYDGSSNKNILLPSSMLTSLGTTHIRMILVVDNVLDLGAGPGNYVSQTQISGLNPIGTPLSDLSTDGNNPDPDDNNDPFESEANVFYVDSSTPVELIQFEVE